MSTAGHFIILMNTTRVPECRPARKIHLQYFWRGSTPFAVAVWTVFLGPISYVWQRKITFLFIIFFSSQLAVPTFSFGRGHVYRSYC